jgi:hypothetical protein
MFDGIVQSWIASIFFKRALLAFATTAAAFVAAHVVPDLTHLSAAGVSIAIQIDPPKLAEWLGIALTAAAQGAHEWAAAKWPDLGKYI